MHSDSFVRDYLAELGRVIQHIPTERIDRVIDVLFECWRAGKTVYLMGNGGSASTATHFACDLAKCTIVPGKSRLKALSLVDNVPLVSAWINDSGFASIFAEQLEPWLNEGDVLIGVSVHGGSGEGDAGPWSQNLVRAIRLAQERRARVVGFSGFDGGPMKQMADVCIVVPVDREPLGTPLVESLHVALHHLICTALRQRIESAGDEQFA